MVLVPEERLLQLDPQKRSVSDSEARPVSQAEKTITATLNRLDMEMSEILKSNAYGDEREKWLAYLRVLQRYLHFVDGERAQLYHELVKEQKTDTRPVERSAAVVAETRMNDSIIVESVPAKFRNKAKLLLRRLHDAPSSDFSWNAAGVVSVNGETIKHSNIVDLVNDAMRSRKMAKPAGRRVFANFLRAIQAPREFVGNDELWLETQANSTLRSPRSNSTTDADDDEDVSDTSHSEFYSGSESNKLAAQSGRGKRKRFTWSSLKLSA